MRTILKIILDVFKENKLTRTIKYWHCLRTFLALKYNWQHEMIATKPKKQLPTMQIHKQSHKTKTAILHFER